MKTLLALLLTLTACDELVVGTPSAETQADARPVPDAARAWPTSHAASVAWCSPVCRWTARCVPGMVVGDCELECQAELGSDDTPPAGSDETIDACVRAMHAEARDPHSPCEDYPYTMTPVCVASVRPCSSLAPDTNLRGLLGCGPATPAPLSKQD